MSSIADADAFFDPERMLTQHQAALTVLQGMLADPETVKVRWLDLASGRGQIIAQLETSFSATERGKLIFQGYDIDNVHSRTAERTAASIGLSESAVEIGDLGQFWRHSATDGPWDFITLTNTIHEICPASFSEILARCIERLSSGGCLFIYDMEKLPDPELGAVLWMAAEIKTVLTVLCRSLGSEGYEPAVAPWTHRTCNGWSAQIIRAHLRLPNGFEAQVPAAIVATATKVAELLGSKLKVAKTALESLTRYGPETQEETSNKEDLLFQFWALSRALEAMK